MQKHCIERKGGQPYTCQGQASYHDRQLIACCYGLCIFIEVLNVREYTTQMTKSYTGRLRKFWKI